MLKNLSIVKKSIVVNSLFSFLFIVLLLFSFRFRVQSLTLSGYYPISFYTRRTTKVVDRFFSSFEYFNSLNTRHIKPFVTFPYYVWCIFNWLVFHLLCCCIVDLSCWFHALNKHKPIFNRFKPWDVVD